MSIFHPAHVLMIVTASIELLFCRAFRVHLVNVDLKQQNLEGDWWLVSEIPLNPFAISKAALLAEDYSYS